MANARMTWMEWALLGFLSVIWGGSFFFNGVAVRSLPPFTIVVGRVGVAALVLHVMVRARGLRMPASPRIWTAFLGMGVLNNAIPFSLIVWGQSHIASGLASILNATTPLFTVVLAHFLPRDETMTPLRISGVIIGIAGVAVMIGLDSVQEMGLNIWAQVAILGASCSYACAGIHGRSFKKQGIDPMVSATGQVTCSSLVMLPVACLADQPWNLPAPGWEAIGAVLGLAVLSTALAYTVYFRILGSAGATNVLLVTLLVPVSAVLLGVTFLQEQLLAKHLLGMACIAVGLAAIDGRGPARTQAFFASLTGRGRAASSPVHRD